LPVSEMTAVCAKPLAIASIIFALSVQFYVQIYEVLYFCRLYIYDYYDIPSGEP
jgi:hypothetical protein